MFKFLPKILLSSAFMAISINAFIAPVNAVMWNELENDKKEVALHLCGAVSSIRSAIESYEGASNAANMCSDFLEYESAITNNPSPDSHLITPRTEILELAKQANFNHQDINYITEHLQFFDQFTDDFERLHHLVNQRPLQGSLPNAFNAWGNQVKEIVDHSLHIYQTLFPRNYTDICKKMIFSDFVSGVNPQVPAQQPVVLPAPPVAEVPVGEVPAPVELAMPKLSEEIIALINKTTSTVTELVPVMIKDNQGVHRYWHNVKDYYHPLVEAENELLRDTVLNIPTANDGKKYVEDFYQFVVNNKIIDRLENIEEIQINNALTLTHKNREYEIEGGFKPSQILYRAISLLQATLALYPEDNHVNSLIRSAYGILADQNKQCLVGSAGRSFNIYFSVYKFLASKKGL